MNLKYTSLFPMLAFTVVSIAQAEELMLETVEVTAQRLPLSAYGLNEEDIAKLRASTNDTASLLKGLPGLSLYSAGGVSSLPAIHGMADDRLRIQVGQPGCC